MLIISDIQSTIMGRGVEFPMLLPTRKDFLLWRGTKQLNKLLKKSFRLHSSEQLTYLGTHIKMERIITCTSNRPL